MVTADRGPPLCVGREAELERLGGALDATLAGRGRLVLLTGDPGSGRRASLRRWRPARRRAARASPGGAAGSRAGPRRTGPGSKLRTLAAEWTPRALAAGAPAAAREAGLLVPELAGGAGQGPTATDPDAARFALFDGVAELLLAAARERPLVLALEDLHAADHTSLLLLDLLAPRLAGAPLLVVGTLRLRDPATDAHVEGLLARLGRRGELLELTGLELEATRALATVSAGRELTDAAIAALQQRTEGNPFYVLSLARVLGDAGEPASPIALPAGVRDTIARRLAPLSEGTRVALAAASVLGRDFTAPRLARLRGVEPGEALALVDPAVRPVSSSTDARRASCVSRTR